KNAGACRMVPTGFARRWTWTWVTGLAIAPTSMGAGISAAGAEPAPAGTIQPAVPDAMRDAGNDRGEISRQIIPGPLRPPVETPLTEPEIPSPEAESLLRTQQDPPLGFAGPSRIQPHEVQQDSHFVPIDDRCRIGFPEWDRYGKGHPPVSDYPYVEGQ